MTFSFSKKLAAIKREIGKRRDVYPRLIDQGKMTREHADYQIAIFEAIQADYELSVSLERKEGELAL